MGPAVKRAKTAFQFYQADALSRIRKEMGPGTSMGDAMTELSARWKTISSEDRQPYADMEAADRARFLAETEAADAEKLAEQEARRLNLEIQEGEAASSRGARQEQQALREDKEARRRELKERREAEMDDEELEERRAAKAAKKKEIDERQRKRAEEEAMVQARHTKLTKEEAKKAANRLDYLFKQSSIFAKLKMGNGKATDDVEPTPTSPDRRQRVGAAAKQVGEEVDTDDEEDDKHHFLTKQPDCIKFGQMKPYQLEGLNWMIHLAEKGLNGILADEMGLGKTLQSISILGYLHEFQRIQGPHLICVPKSTLSNWMNELQRWCPCLRVIRFHGSKEEREALKEEYFTNEAAAHDGRRPDKKQYMEKGEWVDDNSDNPRAWDVCVSTYEVCNAERKTLQKFAWRYLIIDEAHRLKNEASMFSQTVRTFHTKHRLLLTGTPLQNNLHELWALLNFLLPDIFGSSDQFDQWFNLEIDDEDAKKEMISQLHKVLRPFMIRRLKVDVAKGLPPKTETLIMVGMSKMQKQLYKKLLLRDLDSITGGPASGSNRTAVLNIVMQLRKCCGHPYLFEGLEDRNLDPLGEHLVENCGKLVMVDKLLKKLKERGSRVLIFTQMTRVLDILEDFLIMRGYKYCRIDGNTTYDDREAGIDSFNAPNSDKFVFILSTRAGGLGINLQTADICILYDSDWNPQADLQAQDRCHRLGQKKPVFVYRMVSENTIEEKIVERAQQKLKLDAMVVQQGRLKEKDSKISKEEILAAIRFGADTVFRSEESTITDDDIDVILERGAAKTKELADKIQKAEKGDLLDFRLDGGLSAQTFEGIDYSDKELRKQLRLLAADSMGKRERRAPPTNYNPIIEPKKSMVLNNERIKLPRNLRLPAMEDHHFYNRERLLELDKMEFQTYATLREIGQLPPRQYVDAQRTLLPPELAQEKIELLDEGFGTWTRTQFFQFVKAVSKFGRDDMPSIAADMDMPEQVVAAYSESFWNYGEIELKKEEWERISSMIDRGEKKIAKQKKLTALLTKFVETFKDPRHEMTFANRGTTYFAVEQDRALLCAVAKHGYGNWDDIREEIRNDVTLKFQHMVQGMNTDTIAKRVDYRMRQMEKECEAREKAIKLRKPINVLAAEKTIASIKEVEDWETEAIAHQLRGEDAPLYETLSEEAQQAITERLQERQPFIDRLREIEIQVRGCYELAQETKKEIMRGAQYVNYSNITLRAGGINATKDSLDVIRKVNAEDVESRINPQILKVPECGQCLPCTDRTSRKLCVRRLETRNKLLLAENKKLGSESKKASKGTAALPVSSAATATTAPTTSKKRKAVEITIPKKGPGAKALNLGPSATAAKTNLVKKKPRITSQGNKRMSIPDELLPDFCNRIGAGGTAERMKIINKFVEDYPDVSVRQVTFKFAEITTKECPPGITPPEKKTGRAFQFYLRPRLYYILSPDDRPKDWERLMKEDELLWVKEVDARDKEEKEKNHKMKQMMSSKSNSPVPNDNMDSISVSASAVSSARGGEETEEEDADGQPEVKKARH